MNEISDEFVTAVTVMVPRSKAEDAYAIRDAIANALKAFEDSMRRVGLTVPEDFRLGG
jgi:hypothetical protein